MSEVVKVSGMFSSAFSFGRDFSPAHRKKAFSARIWILHPEGLEPLSRIPDKPDRIRAELFPFLPSGSVETQGVSRNVIDVLAFLAKSFELLTSDRHWVISLEEIFRFSRKLLISG